MLMVSVKPSGVLVPVTETEYFPGVTLEGTVICMRVELMD